MRTSDIIRNLREARGMTQMDMARMSGISQSAISSLEVGARQPSMEMLDRLADFFGVPRSTFLQSMDEEPDASTMEIVEQLHHNPKQRLLFSKTKYLSDKDLDVVLSVVNAISREREGE